MLPVDMALSPYRPESFDGFVKKKVARKVFFNHKTVLLYRTKGFCTQGVKIYR